MGGQGVDRSRPMPILRSRLSGLREIGTGERARSPGASQHQPPQSQLVRFGRRTDHCSPMALATTRSPASGPVPSSRRTRSIPATREPRARSACNRPCRAPRPRVTTRRAAKVQSCSIVAARTAPGKVGNGTSAVRSLVACPRGLYQSL